MNNLSRNKPVAFVVGAAGFIGSHLVEKFLEKGVQVVGCDSFYGGTRENLTEASKDKNFHLISQSMSDILDLDFPRLDYAVFTITEDLSEGEYKKNFNKFLDLCKKYTPKVILCSSIDLYDSKESNSDNLKLAEKELAKISLSSKINARVVRLSGIFGPRMNFRTSDPMGRLIKSAVQNTLNQEQTPLEFTTRALYISDAVDLLVKTIMHGFTAQKIYDGVSPEPIKVSEIKQLLIDPVWYEEKGFKSTELPPWPTPNLNKTTKELSWKPRVQIIPALKETLAYFKDHQINEPKEINKEEKPTEPWQFSKAEKSASEVEIPVIKGNKKKNFLSEVNGKNIKSQIITTFGLVIIFFAIIFPILKFCFSAIGTKIHLENSISQVALGNFNEALNESNMAAGDAKYLNDSFASLSFVKNISVFKYSYETLGQSLSLVNLAMDANLHTVKGASLLAGGLSMISGEKVGDTNELLNSAKTEFSVADSEIGQVSANLATKSFTNRIPSILQAELISVEDKINSYHQTINLGRSLVDLLPQIIASDGEKSYLFVFEDNRILRPGGGVIRSYVEVTFNHGKLKEIKGDKVENLDSSFTAHIDPPVELKNDLGESNWRLKDAAFDPDFPTSARNITWFFGKEAGVNVSGVVALDLESISKLLAAIGPLKIGASSEEINSANLTQKIALTRDGNQVSADVLKVLVERIFYLSKQNWVVLAKNSEESLGQKHLLLYLSDQNAFSYISSRGWVGAMPLQTKEVIGEKNESLALSETNMTQGQDSQAVERSINIESNLDENGMVSHKLSLNYSATEKLTGPYKQRIKIYLPSGTKMQNVSWGEKVIKDWSPFSDFGDSGYSFLLELGIGEQKQLVLEYQDLAPAKFDNNQLKYKLDITKQVGQVSIPVSFKLMTPKAVTAENSSVSTQLSQDRSFEVILKK